MAFSSPSAEFNALVERYSREVPGKNWHYFDGSNAMESTLEFREWLKGKKRSKACKQLLKDHDDKWKASNQLWRKMHGMKFRSCGDV